MRGQAALLHYSGKVALLKIAELFVEYQKSGVMATVMAWKGSTDFL